MPRLTVDGRPVEAPEGASVLDALLAAGLFLPHLCKDPDRPPIGSCRTCLVDIEGRRGLPASCTTPVEEGMAVRTASPVLDSVRRGVLRLTAAMRPEGPPVGELAEAMRRHGVEPPAERRPLPPKRDDSSPFFSLHMDGCILCRRCVVACNEVQHIGAISFLGRGSEMWVGPSGNGPVAESICTSCGQCVATCPTDAISAKRPLAAAVKDVVSTCPYCGVGCGVVVKVDGEGRLLGADDDPANPSTRGMLCVKGRFGLGFVQHRDRLTTPLIRQDGELRPASWDEALDLVADRLVRYRGSFGALGSAKATNEDGYALQKFVRLVMGTNSIDHCARLCHAPSVEAMSGQLGSGAASNSYDDFDLAGCLVIVGADPSSNHPVVAARFRNAVLRGAKLVVINPKHIELCDYADVWLRPLPGTDVTLLNALANVVLTEGLWDEGFVRSRTEGFEEWRRVVERYTPEEAERVTAVPAEDIRRVAQMYARPPFGSSCLVWGMGITQHTMGTHNANALVNLALVSGQVGKPGSGLSPLRGQNNVQGCSDMGVLPNVLPGYQPVATAAAKFGQAWGGELSPERGLRVTEMVEAAYRGELKAMLIMGENPMVTEPHIEHAREALERLELLVAVEIFPSETVEMAHVVLPAASFAEKDGTFSNSERRVQRVRRAVEPVGESRPDWEIVCDLARRVCRRLGLPAAQFEYGDASQIFAEMASLTPILAGMSYERFEREGGLQWPCPTSDHPGTPRLHGETFPRGRGLFVPVEQGRQAAELPDAEYPLILNTGRILYHWHAGTMTRRVDELLERAPEVTVAVNPADAAVHGLAEGDDVVVQSRRGELTAKAVVTEAVRKGEVFIPFYRLADSAANLLTNAVYDPQSGIPEYKVCAVRIGRPGELPPMESRPFRRRMRVV